MAIQELGTVAVLAEKPSVARDIASVLGATSKRDGYLHGSDGFRFASISGKPATRNRSGAMNRYCSFPFR
jgi:hypothetical protein